MNMDAHTTNDHTKHVGALVRDMSQNGEPDALRTLLSHSTPQLLVDVGANDGLHMSNSAPFIEQGWKALLIEPHPVLFRWLRRRYRDNAHVQCAQCACAEKSGTRPLYTGGKDNLDLCTLCTDNNPWFAQSRGATSIPVRVETLTTLLDQAAWPSDFGMLLIDTEGMDAEVLYGLDFSRYRPRIILTEEYLYDTQKHTVKERLLQKQGYVQYTKIGCNAAWCLAEYLPS